MTARAAILLLAGALACCTRAESRPTPPAAPGPVAAVAPVAAPAATQEPLPTDPAALRERAAAAENQGRNAEAADAYLRLVDLDPQRAEWTLAAGRCLGLAGRFNDAIELLGKKRAEFPGLLEIPALLARTFLLRVERDPGLLHPELAYADAIALATEVLTLQPDHEDARLILAQARYAQGDAEGALAAAEEAVRRHPQRAGAHVLTGRIAYDQFAATRRVIDSGQLDAERTAELLGALDRAKREAEAAFRRAAALDPSRSFAHVMLGKIAALDRDTAAALRAFGDALAIDPEARVEHTWIADKTEPAARRAFYRDALARYQATGRADPVRAATLTFYEAMAIYAQGGWQEARERFAASRAQNPTFVNADYYGAMCAWRLGDQDGAEALAAAYAAASAVGFADVLRALPPDQRAEVTDVVERLGHRAYQQQRKDRSRDLNHVIACLRDSADAWNNYAFLSRETGRYDEAWAGYQHALEKEPDSPQLWNDAAVILQDHLPTPDNLEKAKSMYRHAIELADAVLADAAATQLSRDRARQARSDAELNLAKFGK